tara:strand:+ start:11578 stop:12180 length:603 start_codon:yes stop_codon:yes gene_type:complete
MGYNPEENEELGRKLSEWKEYTDLAEKLKAAEWALGCADDHHAKANLENAELGRKLKAHKIQVVDLERAVKFYKEQQREFEVEHGKFLKDLKRSKEQIKSQKVEIELDTQTILNLGEDYGNAKDELKLLQKKLYVTEQKLEQKNEQYNWQCDENITLCADLKAMTERFDDAARAHGELMDERDMLKVTVIDQAMKIAWVK